MGATGFKLPNGQVASYEWGSYCIQLLTALDADKDVIPELLAGFSQRTAIWSDAHEFERTVAILHESAHCLQDLTTGVGLWDYALAADRWPDVVVELGRNSRTTPFGTRVAPARAPLYQAWQDAGFVPQSPAAAARRAKHLRERIALVPGASLTEQDAYAIDRLLEADAVMQVHLTFESLKKGPPQVAAMLGSLALWSAPHMAEDYQGVFYDLIEIVRGWADADRVDLSNDLIRLAMLLTVVLVDISLAHPSPSFVAGSELELADHDPGLKFLLLMSSLWRLDLASTQRLAQALEVRDVERAEAILLAGCVLPYATSREIYEDWLVFLRERQRRTGGRIVEMRIMAMEARLQDPSRFLIKSVPAFLQSGLPLIIVNRGGYRLTSMAPHYIVGDAKFELMKEISEEQSSRRFVHSFIDGPPMVCAKAELGICQGRGALCSQGLRAAGDFPAGAACAVRTWADASGLATFSAAV
jgi:hypothetical protein